MILYKMSDFLCQFQIQDGCHHKTKFYIISSLKTKKKICVFMVTRPTLIFASDPMNFYTEFG